jgi:HD-GYP domain-containing protein (c-di-GMP phosphodiesterase class II)
MSRFPLKARVFILLVYAVGLLSAVVVEELGHNTSDWVPFVVLIFLATCAEYFVVKLPIGNASMTVSGGLYFASLILLGPLYGLIVATISLLIADGLLRRRAWYRIAFNISMQSIVLCVGGIIFYRMSATYPQVLSSTTEALGLLLAAAAFAIIPNVLVSAVVALSEKMSFWTVWRGNHQPLLLNYAAVLPTGLAFAILWLVQPLSVVLTIVPLVAIRQSFEIATRLRHETEEALYALVRVLHERDGETADHSEREARYAEKIARRLGLTDDEIRVIVQAARLHDIGKVGVRDSVLRKAGPLTDEEWAEMTKHPVIGSDILNHLSLFRRGAKLVRHHHERYDGKGYPDGLKGEEIPLGSRIIAVADAFDAMISDRPYRKGIPVDEALRRLAAEAGRQFDPVVVGTLIKIVTEELTEAGLESPAGEGPRLKAVGEDPA